MLDRAVDFGAFVFGERFIVVDVIGAFGLDDKIQFFIARDGVYAAGQLGTGAAIAREGVYAASS
jgi:hypothetical protein